MYSLISQKEAEYTAAMALESKQDSIAMKTIAIMTVIFLPGTFVATFFSMNMVDWAPSGDTTPKLSRYMWVYWIVAIPLTVFVLLLWISLSRRESHKARMRLRINSS
jgi:Mg2+ and Co2+ transporter CorA